MLNNNERRYLTMRKKGLAQAPSRRRLFLIAVISVATLASSRSPVSDGSHPQKELKVQVFCPHRVDTKRGENARISCFVENRAREALYLLAEPLALEGPLRKSEPYLYYPVDLERTENALRFDRKPRWFVMFRRVVHLDRKSFAHFVRLESGAKMGLNVRWLIPSQGDYPSPGEWISQIKLIYLDSVSRESLLKPGALPDDCRRDLLAGLSNAPVHSSLELGAERPVQAPRISQDGCGEVVSPAFKDVFSERFVLRVRKWHSG
jgi:hypothetical protein